MSTQDEATDRELIAQLMSATGREANDALIRLIDRHGKAVMNYLIVKFRVTAVEAEDIFGEALKRAYERIGTFDPARGTFRPWLIKIALNIKLQELRDQRTRERLARSGDQQALERMRSGPGDASDRATAEDLVKLVVEYMKDRSRLDQAIVRALMHYEDESVADEDIARAYGKTVGNVRKRKSDLRTELREVLVERQYPLLRKRGGGR